MMDFPEISGNRPQRFLAGFRIFLLIKKNLEKKLYILIKNSKTCRYPEVSSRFSDNLSLTDHSVDLTGSAQRAKSETRVMLMTPFVCQCPWIFFKRGRKVLSVTCPRQRSLISATFARASRNERDPRTVRFSIFRSKLPSTHFGTSVYD